MKQSVLNTTVSGFENSRATAPKDINLLTWLTSEKYRDKVEQIRTLQDENLQKSIKATLPAITPSGRFSYRDTEHFIEHSGFLSFDIDKQDNTSISFNGLREEIGHIKNVAYCGLSCRGKGLWGLVPVPKCSPEEHKHRFAALAKDFKDYGIVLDPVCRDITRLRIYSCDPDAYFNHDAKLYTKIIKPQPKKSVRPAYSDTRERVEAVITGLRTDITEDYQIWLKIGCAFADEFGDDGRVYFHSVSKFHSDYNPTQTDRLFDEIIKHDYDKVSIGWFFNLLKDYGIRINEPEITQTPSRTVITKPQTSKVVKIKPGPWTDEIAELGSFFSIVSLTAKPLRLNRCSTITDLSLFINSHLDIVKANNGNPRYLPYLTRLQELKQILTLNNN